MVKLRAILLRAVLVEPLLRGDSTSSCFTRILYDATRRVGVWSRWIRTDRNTFRFI